MQRFLPSLFMAASSLLASAYAQQQVYRCEADGKVSYAHQPCLNAQAIDTTPTQGLHSMTGHRKPSADVRRNEQQRALAEAVRPITRMSPETMDRESRRHKLLPEDRAQCLLLDARLPDLEKSAQRASRAHQASAGQDLYQARQRFYELHC